ncbi:MAG: hypothetical protein EAZ14_11640 [Runella slithyformis]|nr:MAG: hypothetical protein EAZ14_11640 [Runella slithyformis]
MHLRTELLLPPSSWKITQKTRLLTVGSCFAEVMGQQLQHNKLSVLANPFGTIFNPVSIAKLIEQSAENQLVESSFFAKNQDTWFHYDFHSSSWGNTQAACAAAVQRQLASTHEFLKSTDCLIITFGTAFVYRHVENGQIVANCHKMPAHLFKKELLTTTQVVKTFEKLHAKLKAQNAVLKLILTVSPVRHTRDTLPLNQVSKSTLRVACHELTQLLPDCHYFPSYELMLDDLRDYRFYKSDLIHPNEVAEAYIFEQFADAYFSPELKAFSAEWQKIRQALAHRPQQTGTVAHRQFLENLLQKLTTWGQQIDTTTEIAQVQAQLVKISENEL